MVALPEDHPLSSHDIVHWDQLRHETLLLPLRGPGPEFLKLLVNMMGYSDPCHLLRYDVGLDRFLTMVGTGWGVLLALEGATGIVCPGVTFREVHDSEDIGESGLLGRRLLTPGTPYALLHSISHALMAEIALDCGYPASSSKERVYALSSTRGGGDIDRFGILIYTASAGAQGTLGGLVASAPRFARILHSALDRLRICSNAPVCTDHEPDDGSGDRATHGAACHGCLLIAETSCEMRNLFLDPNLLVPTMAGDLSGFFE